MRGRGRGWLLPRVAVPSGYRYIGPCRCGFGPDAYYQDPSGRIVHASQVFRFEFPPQPTPTEEDLKAEVEWLKGEKTDLEKRIKDIEEQLKKEQK